jgi:Na+/H+ antiporter NhaD/arsenite permease-like protein
MGEPESTGPVTRKRDVIIYILAVATTAILLWRLLSVEAQIIAGTVFIATVLGTLAFWRFRLAIAFAGIATLLATGTLSIEQMIFYMNIDVITFLIAMMVLVYIAKESGFFTWLLGILLRFTKNDPRKVLIILLIMSTLMAALVDEVTSILFIIAVSFEYCKYFELNPYPYTISTVLATNIGSSATMLGNPVGILIGFRGGLTFEDFLIWAMPVALISLAVIIVLCTFWYRKDLKAAKIKVAEKMKNGKTTVFGSIPPEKMKDVKLSGILLFATVIMVALHYRLELALNVERFVLLLVAAYTGAAVGLLWKRGQAQHLVERGVDWWTLTFFMFLFAKAGALQYTHLTDVLASAISSIATSQPQMQIFIVWFSGIASAVLDNVVLVAALIPVINSLIALGFNGFPLWWALLFGGVYGGNITMIGSTANIVALGMLEKNFNYHMKFFKWFWIGLLGGFLPMLVGTVWLMMFFH